MRVARSTLIKAPAAQIMIYLDDYSRFNDWSPWKDKDPETRYVFSGPERGVGARMEWHSDKPDVGSGTQQIISVDGDRQVRWSVEFGGQGANAKPWLGKKLSFEEACDVVFRENRELMSALAK